MFTSNIVVEEIDGAEVVTMRDVQDINDLLQQQREGSGTVDHDSLALSLKRMKVVVARNGDDRIVGLGVLTRSEGLNYKCAEIRHLVIREGLDALSVGKRVGDELVRLRPDGCAFIDAGGWVQNDEMKGIFVALGFKDKPDSRFRLRTDNGS